MCSAKHIWGFVREHKYIVKRIFITMQLSKRLKMVVDCVDKGMRVADVGCDHAYISIYLVENNIAPSTIALDINKGPLMKADENIIKYNMTDRIKTRLSDGLHKLEPGEADSIVAAGMGGALMIKILEEGRECVRAAKELVLQPQSEPGKLRRYLEENGMQIIHEAMCIDDGKYYVVFKAVHGDKLYTGKDMPAEEITTEGWYTYGKLLLERKDEILKEYLLKEMASCESIINNLQGRESESAMASLRECKVKYETAKAAYERYMAD